MGIDAGDRKDSVALLRARLVSAVAAGWALNACHGAEPVETVKVRPPATAASAGAGAGGGARAGAAPPGSGAATGTTAAAGDGARAADGVSAPGPAPGESSRGLPGSGAGGDVSASGGGARGGPPLSPIATAPPVPGPAPAPAVKGTRCEPPTKPEEYCLDVGANAPSQLPDAQQHFEANGCVSAAAVRNMCFGVHDVLSGPRREGKKCCFTVCRGIAAPCGRPLVVDAERSAPDGAGSERARERVATLTRGGEWAANANANANANVNVTLTRDAEWAANTTAKADASMRALRVELCDAWRRDALAEHASIAAFSRFALEMLAVGAPASFVEEAHRAALDEIEHTRLCLALALALASAPDDDAGADASAGAGALGPGPLSLEGITLRSSLAHVAAAAVEEGCCGETFAALAVTRARALCTTAHVSAVLSRIAEDESRHAELSWRFAAWALARDTGEVRAAIEHAFARGLARLAELDAKTCGVDERDAAAFHQAGRLTERELAVAAKDARERLIGPAMQRLLAQRA